MAQIRDLIGNEKQVWGVKDTLRDERILEEKPVDMNKTRFEQYLKAFRTKKVVEYLQDGVTTLDDLEGLVARDVEPVLTQWHKRSAEIKRGKRKHDRMVKRHRGYTAHIDPDKGE
ncbi:MAG: hypothetical protein DRI65_16625 [Chloroflexota bacterium]|nr:MAG: hypothetical protein DRI65_16625 [Chloroflexota bacterium]